ncbi:MOSC and FAD-binding oxidoreductase domain-containing protein [Streptomyces olivochromogenes]|uniref:Sulfurase n=1 Tax=Streptomyces olivochromogenes TaxID=1963 RepID=A0A250VTP2_STROL|nr:MOSC and FAD-binding oxidoreductase domain-containing protein [Streptomyces olivochromogenes]KUN38348.1 sulfurase [Streptomyces olivochromogenes]GAX57474.1 sulfurase [Streptomyces olivochromogenes]
MPTLLSVNVGMPKVVSWQGRTVRTGVWKLPIHGPARVRRLNIDGDGQGDTNGHGGEQRAVLVYQIQSYRHWQQYFGRDDFGFGQFGENLTVDGLLDDEVCIGDRYRIGETEFEVTQPRVTCYRVGLRLGEPELPALLVSHHRPGFYMRVIHEGHIQAGDPIVQTRTGPGALSVADTDALLYLPDPEPAKLRLALRIPALSPGWQESFRDLLKSVDSPVVVAATGPAWDGFRPLRVAEVVPESTTVTSIHLAAPDGSRLPAAHAGQYLTLRIREAGRPAPVRSYSLSSTPDAGRYRISVKHEPHGTASGYLTTRLRPGAILDAAAPRGDFMLDEGTGPVLLVSAGIGLTPVLSMLHELAAQDSEREIWWIHGARRPQEHPLAAEAHVLLTSLPHTHEHVFYSTATPEERKRAHAVAGRLTKDKLVALSVPADATAFVCGPASFMTDMQHALTAAGIDPSRIHTELFGAMPSINPGLTGQEARTPHQPPGPPGTGPLVTFARSGISVPFPDGKPSVLELADACDVPTRWSCRTGVCHTCTTPLLSGDVTYSPTPLEPPPDGHVLICCAQPSTDVVLDM